MPTGVGCRLLLPPTGVGKRGERGGAPRLWCKPAAWALFLSGLRLWRNRASWVTLRWMALSLVVMRGSSAFSSSTSSGVLLSFGGESVGLWQFSRLSNELGQRLRMARPIGPAGRRHPSTNIPATALERLCMLIPTTQIMMAQWAMMLRWTVW